MTIINQIIDMGLGKTLQTLCILSSSHHWRNDAAKNRLGRDLTEAERKANGIFPSIVICPPTVTRHWSNEIKKFTSNLKPVLYIGGTEDRKRLVDKICNYDVVISSYEIVRNDIELLSNIEWNYCILDEGHVIKNPESKISLAVRNLKSNHRLILSGTPIQVFFFFSLELIKFK